MRVCRRKVRHTLSFCADSKAKELQGEHLPLFFIVRANDCTVNNAGTQFIAGLVFV